MTEQGLPCMPEGCTGKGVGHVIWAAFVLKLTKDDQSFEDNETTIIVDKKSLFYVLGTELDFSDGLNGKGFQFKNPNATRTCGCGECFAV